MQAKLEFDADLIRRYDHSGPRYTSYPTAVQFHSGFGEKEYLAWAERIDRQATTRPLSLYFHLPFCATVCFYCACNKVVTKDRSRAIPYLERLHREIALQGALFNSDRTVNQLHWGGGTPTFLNHQQMAELLTVTAQHFNLRNDDQGEYSIEIDPREADADTVSLLRELGFNRISLGVQDLEPYVQRAVNRIQSEEQTRTVMDTARRVGFKSVNIDLIYGLPLQTANSFARTLDRIIDASPDRLSIFNYAHLPERFKPQRRIHSAELPEPSEKLAILQLTIDRLSAAGYVYIGMDHFAKPDDELAVAQRERNLYRNFQGYSTHADCDLVAMGITSISSIGDSYSQNVRTLDEYYERIDREVLPVFRGVELDADDRLRRTVISELICHFYLDTEALGERFELDFRDYFAAEIDVLRAMQDDDLLDISDAEIVIRPKGRLLIRNICMVFDRYLKNRAAGNTFSKVI